MTTVIIQEEMTNEVHQFSIVQYAANGEPQRVIWTGNADEAGMKMCLELSNLFLQIAQEIREFQPCDNVEPCV